MVKKTRAKPGTHKNRCSLMYGRHPPALLDILEKNVRELGRPLGGLKVDCSELKVESNHRGEPLVVTFVVLSTPTLLG